MNYTTTRRLFTAATMAFILVGCGNDEASSTPTLHLALLQDSASVESAGPPPAARQEMHWTFPDESSDWLALTPEESGLGLLDVSGIDDGLRLSMADAPFSFRMGGIVAELEDLRFADWESLNVKARTGDRFVGVTLAYNVDEEGAIPGAEYFFMSTDEAPPVFNDGSVQSYAIPLRPRGGSEPPELLRSIAIVLAAPGPAAIDVLSVDLVPRGADYLEESGTRQVSRAGKTYHTLFAHAPAALSFPVDLTPESRLDFGLTVNRGESITYRVVDERAGERHVLFEERIEDPDAWHQRSVDLSGRPPGPVALTLEAQSDLAGAVALWGAPVVSSGRASERPNVVFYVIDGGDADLMSLYGYGRPTTPFLEELAQEGVLFTRAHSNATWTQPSTVSFMTSLHHSVIGGLRRGVHSSSVPDGAVTIAEHFRRAGYPTASFTANPNAGRIIGTDRGVDLMRDVETEHHSTSSVDLHGYFREFREAYPVAPYWVHIQTTDVHEPNEPEEPFAGRFANTEARESLEGWSERIWQVAWADFGTTSVVGFYDLALDRAGIDRKEYFGTRRDLYDETMLHQDHELERFVADLKARGEWENTIFVLGSDHGHPAGTFARFGRGLIDPQPEPWQGAMCDAWATRIPMLVIWPKKITGGRRIDAPVSMIDVLPTLLELADLRPPEVVQGQSLAPLLLGQEQELAPVILDEFRIDEHSGEMVGNIEIIDGRWGASLEIGPAPDGSPTETGRRSVPAGGRWGAVHPFFPEVPRLLLYDLEADPFTTHAVNDEHPELVQHYTELLLEQWSAHQALAQRFDQGEAEPMSPEQLEQLRALGYIR